MKNDMFYGEECFNELDYLNLNLALKLLKKDIKNKIVKANTIEKVELEIMLKQVNKTHEKIEYITKTIISSIINSLNEGKLENLFDDLILTIDDTELQNNIETYVNEMDICKIKEQVLKLGLLKIVKDDDGECHKSYTKYVEGMNEEELKEELIKLVLEITFKMKQLRIEGA